MAQMHDPIHMHVHVHVHVKPQGGRGALKFGRNGGIKTKSIDHTVTSRLYTCCIHVSQTHSKAYTTVNCTAPDALTETHFRYAAYGPGTLTHRKSPRRPAVALDSDSPFGRCRLRTAHVQKAQGISLTCPTRSLRGCPRQGLSRQGLSRQGHLTRGAPACP